MNTLLFRIVRPDDGSPGFHMHLHRYLPDATVPLEPPHEDCPLGPEFVTEVRDLTAELTLRGGDFGTRRRVGQRLYQLIAETPVGQEWLRECPEAPPGAIPSLRTYFSIEPEELQQIPWELMHNGAGRVPFRAEGHRPMRGHPNPTVADSSPDTELPINILIVVCDVDRDGDLSAMESPDAEVDAIYAALTDQPGLWHVEVLRRPDREQLQTKIASRRPQILHFIGETWDASQPTFRITSEAPGETRETRSYPVSELDRLLPRDFRPRLLILNGCRTAQMLAQAHSPLLASRAIITNQTVVYGPPAIAFSDAFYRYLAQSGKLDEAMWRTRDELYRKAPEDEHYWGIPVLTVYGPPETIFQQDLEQIAAQAPQLIDAEDFKKIKLLVDRLDPSRQVWQRTAEGQHNRMVMITGGKASGKSQLVHSCMLVWRLRGHPAILLDANRMKHAKDGSSTDASLKAILLSMCESLVQLSIPPELQADLAQIGQRIGAVNHRSQGNPEDPHPFASLCEKLFEITKRMTTRGRPLMIAFDHVELMKPEQLSNQLKESLLAPIANGEAGEVYAVIAVADELDDWMRGWPRDEEPWDAVDIVPLGNFQEHEAVPLSREYGARKGWPSQRTRQGQPVMAEWLTWLSERPEFTIPWLPSQLPKLAAMFSQERLR